MTLIKNLEYLSKLKKNLQKHKSDCNDINH